MIKLIEKVYQMMNNEELYENYSELYSVIKNMVDATILDKEAGELNKKINEYLQKLEKEEK